MRVMTLTPPILRATPAADAPRGDPLVFARGGTGRRRAGIAAAGFALTAVGIALQARGAGVFVLMTLAGVAALAVAVWRRGRAFEVRREGIRLADGGRVFGEVNLVPWESVLWFGGRPTRGGRVRLCYRQQHVRGERSLPGGVRDGRDAELLLDRLRFVLGDRYPNLRLGGV